MPKTKSGETISWSEYLNRWKEGISMVTPYQKAKAQIQALRMQLIGILCGIAVSIYKFNLMWWITIILTGVLIMTSIQYFTTKKQLETFKTLEETQETISVENLLDEIKGGEDQ